MRFQLNADPAALREQYLNARPFPHIVLDNLFPERDPGGRSRGLPSAGGHSWRRFDSATEKKLGYTHETLLRPDLQLFLYEMNSAPLIQFLQELTAIEGLIPDPWYGGAGPHQIEPGGFLKVHVDFNWHPLMKLDRRLNMLVYLNQDWKEEYGGHLELWNRDVSQCEAKVLPAFNRTVVFSTTDFSFHGHPEPLACPEGRTRKSVSFYYYSNGRPDEERSAPHDTVFRKTHDHDW